MTGWKRWFYYNMGWEYPNDPTEETKRQRHEVMVQIRSYGDNIKDIVLREEGEIPKKIKATRTPTPTIDLGVLHNHNDFLDGTECDVPASIPDYTALLEGIDLPRKKKKRKKRNSNKLNF